ncbi:MAG: hypothetical protein DRN71_04105 [Candidatus Nanohalarchaeota archaeon]|nr:MAG: hypothetical protein DRN71_04105 [Candidatus Nanohaloarchaeota archaeon]
MGPDEQERGEMAKSELEELEYINRSHVNGFLFTNENRAAIVYLLYNQDEKKMQTENMAFHLGISHRTALYHLEILEQCGFVEVREFRRHGLVPMRSVWGLNMDNGTIIEDAFNKIIDNYGREKLNVLVTKRRRNR